MVIAVVLDGLGRPDRINAEALHHPEDLLVDDGGGLGCLRSSIDFGCLGSFDVTLHPDVFSHHF